MNWNLDCSECDFTSLPRGLDTVCPECGSALLVCYANTPAVELKGARTDCSMWRYPEWLPLEDGEVPISLGEGGTPLLQLETLSGDNESLRVYVKDESQNPTGSFKARGLSAAVTRAAHSGAEAFVVPTAGNAGIALSAYGARAGIPVTVFAPETTPAAILAQIRYFGADLKLVNGHIGDCGAAAREESAKNGAFDMSTLKEPYRIEGKKTLGLEVAEQLGWELPDAIIYPTGGGTGLIGMWKCFKELRAARWLDGALPRMYSVQSEGCAPVVRAYNAGDTEVAPWQNPETLAAGLRVPAPFGGKLMLRALRESGGGAVAVSDSQMLEEQRLVAARDGLDLAPEGAASVAALKKLVASESIAAGDTVVLFNTGAGWLYRL